MSAERNDRLFVEHQAAHLSPGFTFLMVTMELEAPSFQDMTFGAETKKACLVDVNSMAVTDGSKLYRFFGDGKDGDSIAKGPKKVDYIYDSEPKKRWCYVYVIPWPAPALKIQSSQFEPIPLTVK